MEKSFKLLPPIMPNFIFYEVPSRPRQEGFNTDRNAIAVAELSSEEAEKYGELMKQAFIEHWRKKKESLHLNKTQI